MKTDEILVIRAKTRATGANIHNAMTLICLYESFCRHSRTFPEDKMLLEKAQMFEKQMHEFVATGVVPKRA